jgi:hypothetical protein
LTSFSAIREGLARYRAAGGTRALVGTVNVNWKIPTSPLADDEPFHLRCDPDEARRRLQRLADLGYDDVLLTSHNHTVEDINEDDLVVLRSLV